MAGPRSLPVAEYRALAQFRHALRKFVRFSEEAVRAAGLTPAQHQLLLAVKGHNGPGAPSASDVAEALQLRLHSAVELIHRAEAAGLLTRRADSTDARRHLLALTPSGEAYLAALSRLHREELRRFRTEMMAVLRELE
jgi:DNA-binding MarR family transcriptional regulator